MKRRSFFGVLFSVPLMLMAVFKHRHTGRIENIRTSNYAKTSDEILRTYREDLQAFISLGPEVRL